MPRDVDRRRVVGSITCLWLVCPTRRQDVPKNGTWNTGRHLYSPEGMLHSLRSERSG